MGLFGSSKQDKETIDKLSWQNYQQQNAIKQLNDEVHILKQKLKESEEKLIEKTSDVEDTKNDDSFVLCAGRYIGGKTIPVGIYNLSIISGTGIVETKKPNEVFERLESNKKMREERGWANCYNGLIINDETVLEISESAKIKFKYSSSVPYDDEFEKYLKKKRKIESEIEYLEKIRDSKKVEIGDLFVLGKGTYYGGSTIPVGIYNLKAISESSFIETKKPSEYFNLYSDSGDGETEFIGLEIKENTKLEIRHKSEIQFHLTSKRKTDEEIEREKQQILKEYEERKKEMERLKNEKQNEIQELKRNVENVEKEKEIYEEKIKNEDGKFVLCAGKYKGNVDIPIGFYDLKLISGKGLLETNKPDDLYFRMTTDKKDQDKYGWIDKYKNLEISEKTILKIDESARVLFSISKKYDFSNEIKEEKERYEAEVRRIDAELNINRGKMRAELITIQKELKILNDDCIKKILQVL